ncbi:MAG TPA: efflux RND transporter periplasmic adaptor subunit [Gemmatimonadaceae bacterium]
MITSRASAPRRFLSTKRVVLAAVGIAVIAGITAALRPEAVEVETAVVRRAPLRVTVTAEGRTRVRDRYVITAPVSGRLERVPLAEGDVVRAGDVIARLAPAPFDEPSARQASARVAAARALAREAATRVRVADAAYAQARRDAERTRRLFEAGALAPRDVEEAELAERARADDLAAARAHVTAAAAEVDQATAALLHAGGGTGAVILIRAPSVGRVLRLAERSERVVAPGSTIAEIGDIEGLEVVVDLLSSDAARVRPGMSVSLDGWGGAGEGSEGGIVRGRVRRVEPAATTRVSALGVEEQRVNVIVDVADPPASLGDGYRVDATIVVWEAPDVLGVPASALVRAGAGWAAYVVDAGRARMRMVDVGRMGGATAEVVRGLAAGDRVIVFPSDKIRDGTRVAAQR